MLFGKKSAELEVLSKDNIAIGCNPESHTDAIKRCGEMLVKAGYVKQEYIEGMIQRDKSFSTAIGNAIAIPHGEKEYKDYIQSTGIVVCTYPDGIEWNGENVKLVIGIAAKGDEHLSILEKIVETFEDEDSVNELVKDATVEKIYSILKD